MSDTSLCPPVLGNPVHKGSPAVVSPSRSVTSHQASVHWISPESGEMVRWPRDPTQRSGCSGFSLGDVKSGRKEENWKHSFGRLWPDIHANWEHGKCSKVWQFGKGSRIQFSVQAGIKTDSSTVLRRSIKCPPGETRFALPSVTCNLQRRYKVAQRQGTGLESEYLEECTVHSFLLKHNFFPFSLQFQS